MVIMRGCACGAVSASPAALAQMSDADLNRFHRSVRECGTCAKDRAFASKGTPHGGPPCGFCGNHTFRAGSCFTCKYCGQTTGCG